MKKNTNKNMLIAIASILLVLAIVVAIVACENGKDDAGAGSNNTSNSGNNNTNDNTANNDQNVSDEGGNENDGNENDGNASTEPQIEYVVWDGNIGSSLGGGSGIESDPYLIADGAQLAYLARQIAMGNEVYSGEDVYYKLTANIDLNGKPWSPIGSSNNISGIKDDACSFRGVFMGDGKIIKNLRVSEAKSYYSGYGLFGYINGAVLSSIVIEDAFLSAEFPTKSPVGVAVGVANDSAVSGVIVSGSITAQKGTVGGLVGDAIETSIYISSSDVDITAAYGGGFAGRMTNSSAINCTVAGKIMINDSSLPKKTNVWGGGFVGYMDGSEIKSSVSNTTVNGNTEYGLDHIGGFIGTATNSTAYLCEARGDVFVVGRDSNTTPRGSGFIDNGNMSTTVQRCSSHGKIYTTSNQTSELVGFAGYTISIDCYSTSNVEGRGYSYGFSKSGTATRCISFGDVVGSYGAYAFGMGTFSSCVAFGNATSPGSYGEAYVFKKIGQNNDDIQNCYRCEDLNVVAKGQSVSANLLGGSAMFREEMEKASFFGFDSGFAAAWDFSEMNIASGVYPKFKV